jgi:hypothetical protein
MNGMGIAALLIASLRPRRLVEDPAAGRRFLWMLLAQLAFFLAVTGLAARG